MKRSEAEKYMAEALKLALKAEGRTHPNPMVGAVIVSSGKIVGRGYHHKAGLPHAEPLAIKNAGKAAVGADLFVTLEPCDHYGKTPPCTDAIIKSGIKKVYVAMKDPNPINSGRGIARLRSSGIKVDLGIMGTEAQFINRAYVKFIKKGLPYITVKTAQSIDGKTAAFNGTSKWISSYRSRMYVRKLRALADAVMVGIGTVLKDDPLLLPSKSSGKKTIRVVLDSRLRIPEKARIIKTAGTGPVVVVTTRAASADKIKRLSARKGVKVMVVKSRNGKVDLGDFLHKITREGVLSIISESGGTLAGGLFDGGFVDEMIFFIAPKILGGTNVSIAGRGVADISEAVELERAEVFSSAGDLVIRATLKKSRDKGATVCLRA